MRGCCACPLRVAEVLAVQRGTLNGGIVAGCAEASGRRRACGVASCSLAVSGHDCDLRWLLAQASFDVFKIPERPCSQPFGY